MLARADRWSVKLVYLVTKWLRNPTHQEVDQSYFLKADGGWTTVGRSLGSTRAEVDTVAGGERVGGINVSLVNIGVAGGCVWVGVGVVVVPGLIGWICVEVCLTVKVWELESLWAGISREKETKSVRRLTCLLELGWIEKWQSTCCTMYSPIDELNKPLD